MLRASANIWTQRQVSAPRARVCLEGRRVWTSCVMLNEKMQRAFSGPLRKMATLHCATIVHRSERLVIWFENRPSPQSHRLYCFPPYSDPYPSLSGDFHMFRASNSPFHPPVSLWNQPLPQPLRFHQGANEPKSCGKKRLWPPGPRDGEVSHGDFTRGKCPGKPTFPCTMNPGIPLGVS